MSIYGFRCSINIIQDNKPTKSATFSNNLVYVRYNSFGLFNVSLGKKIYISEMIKLLNKKRLIKFRKISIKKKDSFYLNNQKLKKIIKVKISKKDLLDYCSKI